MKKPGQVAILRFPTTHMAPGKPRPVLLIAPVPGHHGDWLVFMISTQLYQAVAGFDEIIAVGDTDFETSGLKVESAIRIARLAVAQGDRLMGAIGEIDSQRLLRIRKRLAQWILGEL